MSHSKRFKTKLLAASTEEMLRLFYLARGLTSEMGLEILDVIWRSTCAD